EKTRQEPKQREEKRASEPISRALTQAMDRKHLDEKTGREPKQRDEKTNQELNTIKYDANSYFCQRMPYYPMQPIKERIAKHVEDARNIIPLFEQGMNQQEKNTGDLYNLARDPIVTKYLQQNKRFHEVNRLV